MRIWVRDLTVEDDFELEFPMETEKLNKSLKANHEYIIVDAPGNIEELTNISELNELCKDFVGSEMELEILLHTYFFNELREMNGDYPSIYNFDDYTSSWCNGNGVLPTEEWFGYLLYDLGYNYLPCAVPEELVDYINWEGNWNAAITGYGWREVNYNGNTYLICR